MPNPKGINQYSKGGAGGKKAGPPKMPKKGQGYAAQAAGRKKDDKAAMKAYTKATGKNY